jgi:hypothetical protein
LAFRVEVERSDDAALERHVGGLVDPGDLLDRVLHHVASAAVLRDRDLHADVAALLKGPREGRRCCWLPRSTRKLNWT